MQNTSDQLTLFPEDDLKAENQSLPSDFHARIFQLLEKERVSMVHGLRFSLKQCGLSQKSDPIFLSLKTSKVFTQATTEKTLQSHCKQLPTLGYMTANGNCLIQPGFYPKIESECTLSEVLEMDVNKKYFLSDNQVKSLTNGTQKSRVVSNAQEGHQETIGA